MRIVVDRRRLRRAGGGHPAPGAGARGHDRREAATSPAGARTCSEQDGFTFDAGPTIITAPWLHRTSSSRSADAASTDYVRSCRSTRSTTSGSRTGRCSATTGDTRTSCARGPRVRVRATSTATNASRADRGHLRGGLLADRPAVPDASRDMLRVAPDLIRLQSWRTVAGLVESLHPRRATAAGLLVPSAARRRQPVPDDVDLRADPPPGEARGACGSRWAAPARWCRRSRACSTDLGGDAAAQRARSPRSRSRRGRGARPACA